MILYIFLVGSVIIIVQDNGFLSQLILRQPQTICCPLCSDIGHFGQKWFLTKNLNNESHPECGKGVKDAQMHSNQCVCIFIRWIFQLIRSMGVFLFFFSFSYQNLSLKSFKLYYIIQKGNLI